MSRKPKAKPEALTTLTQGVSVFLRALDTVMQGPSTPKRGKVIARLSNRLELLNDTIRHEAGADVMDDAAYQARAQRGAEDVLRAIELEIASAAGSSTTPLS